MKPKEPGRHGLSQLGDRGKTGEEAWEEEKVWAVGEEVKDDGASIPEIGRRDRSPAHWRAD